MLGGGDRILMPVAGGEGIGQLLPHPRRVRIELRRPLVRLDRLLAPVEKVDARPSEFHASALSAASAVARSAAATASSCRSQAERAFASSLHRHAGSGSSSVAR